VLIRNGKIVGKIQEVDNLHSQIEKVEKTLSHLEIFSPVALLRTLKLVNRRNPLRIIQCGNKTSWTFRFLPSFSSSSPYTKVREIIYHKDDNTAVSYKEFGSKVTVTVNVARQNATRSRRAAALR